jgi:hypothetical protein
LSNKDILKIGAAAIIINHLIISTNKQIDTFEPNIIVFTLKKVRSIYNLFGLLIEIIGYKNIFC